LAGWGYWTRFQFCIGSVGVDQQLMWKHNYTANMQKLIPVFADHLQQSMLGVAGVKWIEAPV